MNYFMDAALQSTRISLLQEVFENKENSAKITATAVNPVKNPSNFHFFPKLLSVE